MGTGTKRHIHKYHKVNDVWACAFSDCTHFMPHNVASSVPGKKSKCWECGDEFILTLKNMRKDEPICNNCELGLNPDDLDDLEAFRKRVKENV